MKKLLTFAALSICAFAFSQTEVKIVNANDSQNPKEQDGRKNFGNEPFRSAVSMR